MKNMMRHRDYYGSAHFDDEELLFYGKVEFIRALVNYESTTAKGLRKAFEEAVDDYINLCYEQKIQPETPFKGSLNVRLGTDLHRKIAIAAALNQTSVNKFITEALNKFVNQINPNEQFA